jgi:hypothetical protein
MLSEKFLTPSDIAMHLNVDISVVKRLMRTGALPSSKIGDELTRVREGDLSAYLLRAASAGGKHDKSSAA